MESEKLSTENQQLSDGSQKLLRSFLLPFATMYLTFGRTNMASALGSQKAHPTGKTY